MDLSAKYCMSIRGEPSMFAVNDWLSSHVLAVEIDAMYRWFEAQHGVIDQHHQLKLSPSSTSSHFKHPSSTVSPSFCVLSTPTNQLSTYIESTPSHPHLSAVLFKKWQPN